MGKSYKKNFGLGKVDEISQRLAHIKIENEIVSKQCRLVHKKIC